MPLPIAVVNPNSTDSITAVIDRSLAGFRMVGGPSIECVTLRDGPPAIETDADIAAVGRPLRQCLRERSEAGAFVIACYSDPGLDTLRAETRAPVFGVGESAMAVALTRGNKFGVVSILPESTRRHLARVRTLGLQRRCAGDIPINRGVLELADEAATLALLVDAGTRLRDAHSADVLILGCAGLSPLRQQLEDATGLPVVDPIQAAVSLALGAVIAMTREGRKAYEG
jgi:allantoin racemase